MTTEKLTKTEILKQKYGISRNKKRDEQITSKSKKTGTKLESNQKEYTHNSDRGRKKFYA